MILLSIDFETSGLDPEKNEITEVGAVLWSTSFHRAMETASYFIQTSAPLSKEITDLTGINSAMLTKFGYPQEIAYENLEDMIEQADAFVGQNVIRFDKRFLEAWAKKNGKTIPEKLWIDTRTDLPGVKSKHLGYMAADAVDPATGRPCGFLNPFPHNAVSDCLTVLRLIDMHPIDAVVARAKQPTVVLQSHQERQDNGAAKKLGFVWNPKYGIWWAGAKEGDVEGIVKSAPFNISIEKIPLEQLWYD